MALLGMEFDEGLYPDTQKWISQKDYAATSSALDFSVSKTGFYILSVRPAASGGAKVQIFQPASAGSNAAIYTVVSVDQNANACLVYLTAGSYRYTAANATMRLQGLGV